MWNYGLVAEGLLPQRGIAAGGGFAQAEIVLYLLPLAVELQQSVPALECSLHIDDLSLAATAANDDECLETLSMGVDISKDVVQGELLLKFDWAKSVTMASDGNLLRRAKAMLGTAAGNATMEGRRLGYDFARHLDKPLRRPTQTIRHTKYKAKLRKTHLRYGKLSGSTGGAFTASMQAGLLFGCESVGLKAIFLRSLRVAKLRALGAYIHGAALDFQWCCLPPQADPFKISIWMPVARWAREWWLTTHLDHKPVDCLSPVELVRAHVEMSGQPAADRPLALVRAAVRTLGWSWKNAGTFVTQAGIELSCAGLPLPVLKNMCIKNCRGKLLSGLLSNIVKHIFCMGLRGGRCMKEVLPECVRRSKAELS
jgi:hypothetical protein